MPCYNSSKTIEDSIKSVLKQTYREWELLIIDDKSKDDTLRLVRQYLTDPRIRLIENEVNMGVSKTRNVGFKNGRGRYIAFLDSDDYWVETKLEKQLESLKSSNGYFSFTSYMVVNESNHYLKKMVAPDVISFEKLLKGSRIGCLTVLIDRLKTGDFKMKDVGHEDYLLWLQLISKNGEATGIDEVLAYYRIGNNSLSSNKWNAAKWQYNIYRKHLNFNSFKSLYYFFFYISNHFNKIYLSN